MRIIQGSRESRQRQFAVTGYQYLTEQRYDQMEPALDLIRRDIIALELPLRSIEVEYGPSQCEFVFQPTVGLMRRTQWYCSQRGETDCSRNGYHVTFMCGRAFRMRCRRDGICTNPGSHAARNAFHVEEEDDLSRSPEDIWQGFLSMLGRRRCSRRRPSTATSGIDPIRWRQIVRSGPGQSRRDDPSARRSNDPATRLENRMQPAAIPTSIWHRKSCRPRRHRPIARPRSVRDTRMRQGQSSATSLREAVFTLKDDLSFAQRWENNLSTTTSL